MSNRSLAWTPKRLLYLCALDYLMVMEGANAYAYAYTAEWISLAPKTVIAPPRSGHVAFSLDNQQDVYVFGGYAEEIAKNGEISRYPTNDLWKWRNDQATWTQVQNSDLWSEDINTNTKDDERVPQQRLAAAAASLQDSAYIFGGWDSQTAGTGGVILQDISSYNANANNNNDSWKPSVASLQESTSRLVAVTIDIDDTDDTDTATLVLLHNHRCTDHVLLFDGHEVRKQATTGAAPSPRGLHAAVSLNNQLVVFGGAAQDGSMSNQVFCLDLTTWIWKEIEIMTSDSSPSPRASPCLCALKDQKSCILFGGAARSEETGGLEGCSDLWILRFDDNDNTAKWEELSTQNAPPGRNAATLTPLPGPPMGVSSSDDDDVDDDDDTIAEYFLLSGGWYPFRTTYSDNFVLKVSQ